MDYIIVVVLVALSGLFSGLTLGLLSLDKSELERKIDCQCKAACKEDTANPGPCCLVLIGKQE